MKVMSAIERCRTVALGGHVARCEECTHTVIAYNSCRNRHCPKCQGAAAKEWLAEREAELLPVGYFHLVFTLPGPIADIAYHNKAAIYGLLFTAAAEATMTIAADPKRLGARIGITAVLHSWGSAMTHHPHVHMIVPGGGISLDDTRWVSCRPGFFLPVRVLSRLFRRLFLGKFLAAHQAGHLAFFGDHAALAAPPPQSRRSARRRRARPCVELLHNLRAGQPRADRPQPGGPAGVHDADRLFARPAGLCRGSRHPAEARRRRCAVEHAMADDRRRQGQGR